MAQRRTSQDRLAVDLADVIRPLATGSRLPSERKLATDLNVSRTALRDRLRMLEALGVIERRQGSGTYVNPLDPAGLAFAFDLMLSSSHVSLHEVHAVRIALERQAAIEAANAFDPVLARELRRHLEIMKTSDDDRSVDSADYEFHDVLMRASRNAALAFFADALSGVLHRALSVRQAKWRQLRIPRDVLVRVHQDIYEAVMARSSERAAAAVDAHFNSFIQLVEEAEVSPWG